MNTETTNPHLKRPQPGEPVTATLVESVKERLQCLPAVAGIRCVQLEHAIYHMLHAMTEDYNGGFWRYYRLSNDGFYMAPDTDRTFRFACQNGYRGVLEADAAGLSACAMAYSHLSFSDGGARFADAYYRLMDFVYQRPDAAQIRAVLD